MIKGPLEADGRLAAKNATKIRAALTQVTNFKSVFERYKETQPKPTDNRTQDRARARAWVMLNVGFNNEALYNSIMHCWAEAYVLGQDAAGEWIRKAEKAQKSVSGMVDWDNWKPGDRATALLVKPVGGFQRYLEQSGGASYFKKFDKETVEMLGTSLADAIEAGLDSQAAALLMKNHVGSPGRALTIAITEQNRAMSFSTIQRYKEAELQKMEWHVSDPCPKCAQNSGVVIEIGGTFPSGNQQPPAHPHCRCVLLPVIPGMEEESTMRDGTPMPSTVGGLTQIPGLAQLEKPEARYKAENFTAEKFVDLLPKTSDGNPNFDAPFIAKEGIKATQNIMREQGFLKPVVMVEPQDFDKLQKEGWTTFYRGYTAKSQAELNAYITDFVQGDNPHLSMGLFGNGTYFGDLATARAYSEADLGGVEITKGRVIEGALNPKAKIVDHITLGNLSRDWVFDPKNAELSEKYIPNRADIAIMHGYDAIRVPQEEGGDYFVILNRGAIVIKNG